MEFRNKELCDQLFDEVFFMNDTETYEDKSEFGVVELGDYTEECIRQLNKKNKTDEDNEETYARYRAGVVRGFI